VLQCTIGIYPHDLIHHYHNSSQYNDATLPDIATPQTTSIWYRMMLQPPHSILMPILRLSVSPLLCNTTSIPLSPKWSFCTSPIPTCQLCHARFQSCDKLPICSLIRVTTQFLSPCWVPLMVFNQDQGLGSGSNPDRSLVTHNRCVHWSEWMMMSSYYLAFDVSVDSNSSRCTLYTACC